MRVFLSLLVFTASLGPLCGATVHAQGWLADRARAQGAGVRLGDFELHPGIGAEGGYDSNVFLSERPQDSALLRIAPHLFISTLEGERAKGAPERKLSLRAGVSGSLRHYFSTNVGTQVGVGQDARLIWRPGTSFLLQLTENFRRTIEPFTEAAAPAATASGAATGRLGFGRDQFDAGARLQLHSRGEVAKAGLGYRFNLDHFEDNAFRDNRSLGHTVMADTSWEFFPKTALFWDGALSFHDFIRSADELSVAEQMDTVGVRNDSVGLRTRVGINGALTPRIGFTLAVGYGAGFFDDGNDYEAVLAQVEGRWRPQENMLWSIGYDREVAPAFQGNFTKIHRAKTKAQIMLAGALVLAARAELSFLDFGNDPNQGERDDIHVMGNLSGEYRFVDWLAVTAEFSYWQNFTDFAFETSGLMPVRDPAEFERFEAWLGMRAFL